MERQILDVLNFVQKNPQTTKEIIKSVGFGKKRSFIKDAQALATDIESAKFTGVENIPQNSSPLIVACNHPDLYDLALGTVNITSEITRVKASTQTPVKINWMVAKNIVSREKGAPVNKKILYPLVNKILTNIHKTYGFVAVEITDKDINGSKKQRGSALVAARNFLRDRENAVFGMYPEGDFHEEGQLLDFYNGIGILAKNLAAEGIAILPANIQRDEKSNLIIKFGPTITPAQFDTTDEITAKVRQEILKLQS